MNQSLQKATIESLHSKNERIKKMRKLNLFCLIIFALIFITLGCAKAQRGNVVTEEGMAKIINGNIQAATAAAERVALCRAVGRQIGIELDSVRVTDNAEALINIIRTHLTGHAKVLEMIKKWTDSDNYRHVKIQAWVSPAVSEKEMKKLEPSTLFLLLDTKIKNTTAQEEIYIDPEGLMLSEMRAMLTKVGYQIAPLPKQLTRELRGILNNRNLTLTGVDNWYWYELAEAPRIVIDGNISILLKLADSATQEHFESTMYTAECHTELGISDNISVDELSTISYEVDPIDKRGTHKYIRRAIRYAIEDTIKAIKDSKDPNFFEKLEEFTGPPSRRLHLYAIGLSSVEQYSNLQNHLRQKLSVFGVGDVRGVRFDARRTGQNDRNLSKIVLTLSGQLEDDFSNVVEHIALTIGNHTDYELLSRRGRTIMIKRR